ncbi:MAG: helix-turn-helix transcriptional regulator [Lachnospiraceae bacterium]|nr:helix-turn-helix transcriptional regulator [Lachnospiraceae bacterium]
MGHLKELRRRRGLTQEGLANVLGTSQQTISRIENNEDMIPTDLLVKLAKFYNVSADYIVALTDEKYNQGSGRDRLARYIEKYGDEFAMYDRLSPDNQEVVKAVLNTLSGMEEKAAETQSSSGEETEMAAV